MTRKFGPMLAAKLDESEIVDLETFLKNHVSFPCLVSPKIDGIRFMGYEDKAMSRSWKPLPNKYLQNLFSTGNFNLLDGEIIVGNDPAAPNLFNKTQSAVMTVTGDPELHMYVFDSFLSPNTGFVDRTTEAMNMVKKLDLPFVHYLYHSSCHSPEQVIELEESYISRGFEGAMIRSLNQPYKFGRSTIREQGLIKIKRFSDAEATIIGFEALQRNMNEPTKDALGYQKRSSHQANKVDDELMGKLLVTSPQWGDFAIGSGFDVSQRKHIWDNRQQYLNKKVTFKYQAHGTVDKPRTPIFKGFRPEVD